MDLIEKAFRDGLDRGFDIALHEENSTRYMLDRENLKKEWEEWKKANIKDEFQSTL